MKKFETNSRKWIILLLVVTDLLLIAGIIMSAVLTYFRMATITNQLVYLQDTTNIIQSDVANLQSNIEATLEEESSLIEDYTIEVVDADFAAGTYDVAVSVTPKEYTDHTNVSIYFGTQEYLLHINGYSYGGIVTLPIDISYDGNVTFLFTEGEKKTTEVIRDYVGFQTGLEDVIYGMVDQEPTYHEGKLALKGNGTFFLEGNGNYKFQTFEFLITADDTEIYNLDLIYSDENPQKDKSGFPFSWDDESTESIGVMADIREPIESLTGDYVMDVEAEAADGANVRIFLRAVSVEGYTFEYELFHAAASEEEEDGFIIGEDSRTPIYTIYDQKGGSLKL